MKKRCFTLVELMVVIGIVAVLGGILLVSLNGAGDKAKRAKAKSEISYLKNAIAAFQMEYNKLPQPSGSGYTKGMDISENAAMYKWMIYALYGKDDMPSALKTSYGSPNKRKKQFLTPQSTQNIDEYLDPWGNAYHIVFEKKYGEGITIDATLEKATGIAKDTVLKGVDVLIWSDGEDLVDLSEEPYKDNVYSIDTTYDKTSGTVKVQ